MRVDTTAPKITLVSVVPRRFSPDGDGRGDQVVVSYRTSEPAHGILLVDGKRVVYTRRQLERSSLEWNGRVDGKLLRGGVYRLQLAAEDRAGNVSRPTRAVRVVVRYITLAREQVHVKARGRFGIGVRTDARSFRWRIAGRAGTAKPGVLVLRAPKRPGRYHLFVDERGHGARAVVTVTRVRRS
jgi:hypothetical protein